MYGHKLTTYLFIKQDRCGLFYIIFSRKCNFRKHGCPHKKDKRMMRISKNRIERIQLKEWRMKKWRLKWNACKQIKESTSVILKFADPGTEPEACFEDLEGFNWDTRETEIRSNGEKELHEKKMKEKGEKKESGKKGRKKGVERRNVL